MPTKTGKPYSGFYGNDISVEQSSNTGVDTTTRVLTDGFGNKTSTSISDDVLQVKPQNDDTTGAFVALTSGGSNILAVDTTNSVVKAGASQVNTLTSFKEMGLFDFSPTAGVHNPMIANNMMFSDSGDDIIEDSSMFGNGADPATTLDLSSDGTPMIAVACYWYLENNITLDSVRYMATADGNDVLTLHLCAFTLDTSTNHGDLSAGAVHADGSVSASNSTVKTGTLSLSTANIDAGKVVIGFVESDSTTDLTLTYNIKYHIR